jgi:DNA-binding NarL/FixJ family response regulator
MLARRPGGRIRNMPILGRRRRQGLVDASVSHVYGAALAASSDAYSAENVTCDVMVDAVAGRSRADARSLIERAVLRSVHDAPHPAFAPMRTEEREVVALARLGGYSVPEIAEALGIAPAEARARMASGLRALAAGVT